MDTLGWMDDRTLMACLCILIAVFSVLLLGLRWFYPRLAGISSVAAGFILGVPATLLMAAVGSIQPVLAAAGGGGLAFVSYIFLYRGVLQFCCEQRARPSASIRAYGRRPLLLVGDYRLLLYGVSAAAFAAVLYFSEVHFQYVYCVVIICATFAIVRVLMAWTLFRCSGGRVYMLAFAFTMALFALLAAFQGLLVFLDPAAAAATTAVQDHARTIALLLAILLICVQGIFYLLMFAGNVAETMEEQAQLDFVSGALNRRGIEDALTAEIARNRRSGGTFSVLLIDVDHFKSVNDRFGHAVGDQTLRHVTESIVASVRVYDILGRFGGDEFLVLLPHTVIADAMHTADRIREAVRVLTGLPPGLELTLSIGTTCCSTTEDSSTILSRADAALYDAKHAGRNCVRMRLEEGDPNPCRDEPLSGSSDDYDKGRQSVPFSYRVHPGGQQIADDQAGLPRTP